MAERQSRTAAESTETKTESAPDNASGAYAAAGRLQAGEAGEIVTTRVPRGVGEPAADAKAEGFEGVAALQEHAVKVANEEAEQGFRGVQVDSTPNENYTLRGVGRGLPTPETQVFTPRGR